MELVNQSFQILDEIDSEKMLKSIEIAGRVCYKSEDKITKDSAMEFVAMVMKRGHESVIEHEKVSVKIVCDRGVSHEIVRHRIASYSQESTRYVNYNKRGITFIIPTWVDIKPGVYGGDLDLKYLSNLPDALWYNAMSASEAFYNKLIEEGWRPEQARSVLPNSLKTEIVVTYNLREWRHFFKLRTSAAAHPQMREITIPMLSQFKDLIPVVFDDIRGDFE